MQEERPKIVDTVSWAASNGDRSENADYQYGKRRLREIDRRVEFLTKRLKHAIIVDPSKPAHRDRVLFGAKVGYLNEDDESFEVTILGVDEARIEEKEISLHAPLARALMGAKVGDEKYVVSPKGKISIEVASIEYPQETK